MPPHPNTAARNREIYAVSLFGLTAEEIGAQYGLAAATVKAILSIEAHKRAVSPELVYCDIRNERDPGGGVADLRAPRPEAKGGAKRFFGSNWLLVQFKDELGTCRPAGRVPPLGPKWLPKPGIRKFRLFGVRVTLDQEAGDATRLLTKSKQDAEMLIRSARGVLAGV